MKVRAEKLDSIVDHHDGTVTIFKGGEGKTEEIAKLLPALVSNSDVSALVMRYLKLTAWRLGTVNPGNFQTIGPLNLDTAMFVNEVNNGLYPLYTRQGRVKISNVVTISPANRITLQWRTADNAPYQNLTIEPEFLLAEDAESVVESAIAQIAGYLWGRWMNNVITPAGPGGVPPQVNVGNTTEWHQIITNLVLEADWLFFSPV